MPSGFQELKAGRGFAGAACWADAGAVTIAPAAPAAPAAAPFRNSRRSTEPVDVLSDRLATIFPRLVHHGRQRA